MPYYLSKNGILVGASQKVMTPTLNNQNNLKRLRTHQVFFIQLLNILGLKKRKTFLIVRNPVNRIKSVYINFFKANRILEKGMLQGIHIMYLKAKSIEHTKMSIKDYSELFSNISIDEFLEGYENWYLKDVHTRPQTSIDYLNFRLFTSLFLLIKLLNSKKLLI